MFISTGLGGAANLRTHLYTKAGSYSISKAVRVCVLGTELQYTLIHAWKGRGIEREGKR